MDKKEIDAFNNLSLAIDYLAQVLGESKKDDDSKTGFFNKMFTSTGKNINTQLKSITSSIKELSDDSKKILSNQKELLKIAKETKQTKEQGVIGTLGEGKAKTKIKDGVKTIILIAGGVLAIGAAFKLIGSVDFASVIALSISLPLIAYAFEKISNIKGLTWKSVAMSSMVIVAASAALLASSLILSRVSNVGTEQLITTIGIAAAFGIMGYGLSKLTSGIKGIDAKGLILLPLVLVTASLAIALSSSILNGVVPIQDILPKFITAVAISAVFVVIAYALKPILSSVKDINVGKLVLLPFILVTMSLALVGSSYVLQYMKPIDNGVLWSIVKTSLALSISFVALGIAIAIISRIISPTQALQGGLSIVIMAGALALSSYLISLGTYENYPSPAFALGFGLSMLLLTIPIIALGMVSPVVVAMGAAGMLIAVGAIVGASHLLAHMNPKIFAKGGILYMIADTLTYFIGKVSGPIIDFVTNILPPISKFITDMISSILPGIAQIISALSPVIDAFGNVIEKIGNAIGGIIEKIGGVIKTVADSITGFMTSMTDSIIKLSTVNAANLFAVAGGIVAVMGALAGGSVAGAVGAAGDKIASLFSGDTKTPLQQFLDMEPTVTKMADSFDKLTRAVTGFSAGLSTIDTAGMNGLKLITTQVVLLSAVDGDSLERALGAIRDKVSIKDLVNMIKSEVLSLSTAKVTAAAEAPSSVSVVKTKSGSNITLENVYDEMVKVNHNLEGILGNTGRLATYMSELRSNKRPQLNDK